MIGSQPAELPASGENWTTSWKRNLLRVNKYIETITKKVWEFIGGCIMNTSCFLILFHRHHILTSVSQKSIILSLTQYSCLVSDSVKYWLFQLFKFGSLNILLESLYFCDHILHSFCSKPNKLCLQPLSSVALTALFYFSTKNFRLAKCTVPDNKL